MVLDNMNPFEKQKLLGQVVGEAPNLCYLCAEYVLNKMNEDEEFIYEEEDTDVFGDYSLVVESDRAIILSVKKYEVQNKFPNDVKRGMHEQMQEQLKFVNRRIVEVGVQAKRSYERDQAKVVRQKQSKMNYP